jgi:hypothetical protein
MAREKKTKGETRISFKLGTSKRKKQRTYRPSFTGILKTFGIICVFAAAGVSRYVAQMVVKSAKRA